MEKYYAKQVAPEMQEDDLFYTYRNKQTNRTELGWNDDIYEDNVIIYGNDDFIEYHTSAYEKVKKIDSILYEYENGCYWKNVSEFVNYYLAKENGKKYTTKEIHEWKKLFDNWNDYRSEKENELKALQLITGKKWRSVTIKGCMQREYQYLYVSEEISEESVQYIEMCYFNTGTEWLVYENEKDYENDEYAYSLYVDGFNAKKNLAERIGCSEEEIVCYEFDDWKKIPIYKEI